MTAYGIFGDVDASPKLVRAALSDLLEAHHRSTPGDEFWLCLGVRNGEGKIYEEILDWSAHNEVYVEVISPAANYWPYVEPSKFTLSPSFMLDVVEMMHRTEGGEILALVGDQTPKVDVLRALAKAKDNGTRIRDLAEAGLTLILFRGDDPPSYDNHSEEETMADEEVEYSLSELGEFADDESDADTAEQAQGLLEQAAEEAGVDPNEYATWLELGTYLQALIDDEAEEPEEEPEPAIEGLTREALVGKEIAEIKQLAKAAGIEGYSKMRREPLINALLGEDSPPAASPAKKAAGAVKAAAKGSASSNGDVAISDADVERIADAVVAKLGTALTSG